MPYPRKLLHTDEQVVLDLVPHWWFITPMAVLLGATMALGITALVLDWADALKVAIGVGVLVVLVAFLVRLARWRTTNFVVTTDRCIYRSGLVSKSGVEIPLDRINTVFFNQGLFERLIGAGDLAIESGGETGKQHFADIRKPSMVQNEIYRQMEDNENRKFDRIRGGGGGTSVAEELGRLDELRARGVLTDEEFAAQKAKLLGQGPDPAPTA